MDHGTSSPPTTVSILNFVLFCGDVATSPAPRPEGAWLQPKATTMANASSEYGDTFIPSQKTLSYAENLPRGLVLNVFVKQLDFVALLTEIGRASCRERV